MEALVSVIVLNWNGQALLGECLESLREQTYSNFEVLVVDNGSTDGSQEYVRLHFPDVCLIELPENIGFCGGNNAGYRYASGDYIALLNNDTRVVPEWLESLVDALTRYPDVGMAASKMVFYDRSDLIDTAGDLFFTCGIGRKRGHLFDDGEAYNKEVFVFGACAGAALYRRTVLDQIGFLDNDFFAYDEDIDLSFRSQLSGWKCVYVPRAKVLHHVSATASKTSERSIYLAKRNSLWVILKNMPAELLRKYGLSIVAYHVASDIKWSLRGCFGPVIRGRVDALRAWKQIYAKRRVVKALRKVSISELESVMSQGWPSVAGQ